MALLPRPPQGAHPRDRALLVGIDHEQLDTRHPRRRATRALARVHMCCLASLTEGVRPTNKTVGGGARPPVALWFMPVSRLLSASVCSIHSHHGSTRSHLSGFHRQSTHAQAFLHWSCDYRRRPW